MHNPAMSTHVRSNYNTSDSLMALFSDNHAKACQPPNFFCPAFYKEILDWCTELQSRTQLFFREMLSDRLISRSPAILLPVGIGGIHSVEIWRNKGVKCL